MIIGNILYSLSTYCVFKNYKTVRHLKPRKWISLKLDWTQRLRRVNGPPGFDTELYRVAKPRLYGTRQLRPETTPSSPLSPSISSSKSKVEVGGRGLRQVGNPSIQFVPGITVPFSPQNPWTQMPRISVAPFTSRFLLEQVEIIVPL